MTDRVDCVVIGAGVVGLAVARAWARAGHETIVLEAADAVGTVTSARTSEVIHSGIYYPTGSLKARLCTAGRRLLYAYCRDHQVPHWRCGKLIVATDPGQTAALRALQQQAAANGVEGVHLTLDLARQARFGPDVEWVQRVAYAVDETRARAFYAAIRRYWPALPEGALHADYAGVRPKIVGPGEAAADFVIQGAATHGVARLVNLYGIESPGLTASLAIAQETLAHAQ